MSNKMALDALTEFDEALTTWANAYPESVFPSPDLAKAAKLLEAGGMTLDAISADAMRHIAKTMHADFADCRAAIAALQAEPQPAIPEGWAFSTADFSLQACGVSEFGGVMLIRTGADRAAWHALTVEPREVIPLYVSGTGRTVAEAIASASKNCTPLPATPPKD